MAETAAETLMQIRRQEKAYPLLLAFAECDKAQRHYRTEVAVASSRDALQDAEAKVSSVFIKHGWKVAFGSDTRDKWLNNLRDRALKAATS